MVMQQPTEQPGGATRVSILTLALAAGAAAALLALASHKAAQPRGPLAFVILALAFFTAEVIPMHLGVGGDRHTISFNELPLAIALVALTPVALVATVVLGSGAALALHRRQRGTKLAFNLAQLAVQAIVAIAVFEVIRHGALTSVSTSLATGAAVVVADTISALLVTAAIALARGTITGAYTPRALLGGAGENIVKALLAIAGVAALIHHNNLALATAIASSATAYLAYRHSQTTRASRSLVSVG
jgi:urease gamma subunit